ncbi:MAG TPA: methyltransferase [Croceibacterium sp.]|nr:methyltransferase [Croceibacterium sp.]
MREPTEGQEQALLALLTHLATCGYRFTTVSPATHARVIGWRAGALAHDLRDVLGWSLPFRRGTIDDETEALLGAAGALRGKGEVVRASVRVSSLGERLFLHSAYPTDAEDSVFFGPDSYRFAAAIEAELAARPLRTGAHVVDIGAGSGVGGIVAGRVQPDAQVTLTDVNHQALAFARVNAAAAGVKVETLTSENLDPVADPIDFAVANPPYIIDAAGRAYRDGGELMGGAIALDMARMAAARLAPEGRLLLYTGATIVAGRSPLIDALEQLAGEQGLALAWCETDPDVFGEELANRAYRHAERIAVIVATLHRR